MVKFTAAKCPSCRADLDVDNDTKKYTCPYCGTIILIDNGGVKETPNVKESKKEVKEERTKKDTIGEAKKLINKGKYYEARIELFDIVEENERDTEARTLIVLACCKEVESDPLYKDTGIEIGSIVLGDLLSTLDELKELDKSKNYLKVLSEYKDNFDDYSRIYDAKLAYKKTYENADRKLNELYILASNKLNPSKANELIKEYFDLDDKKLPHLSYDELLKKSKEIDNKYDEFKLEIDKCIKNNDTMKKNNQLKNIGIILAVILVCIILFMINPWIVYFIGMIALFGYCALVK